MDTRLHKRLRVGWNEKLTCKSGIYLQRWVIEFPWLSVRVHHWLLSDDDRAKHDHPWWFLTFVLRGGYDDHHDNGLDVVKAPCIRFRAAEHRHIVKVHPGGCWTFIVTGPKIRRWGFWVKGKFLRSFKYFYRFGEHHCD